MPKPDPNVDRLLNKLDAHVEREMHPAMLDDDGLLAICDWSRSRSGGPGGQHRNKVETAVTIVHKQTDISAHAGERRSVRENKPVAIRRLRLALATQHRMAVPPGDCRTLLWRERVRKNKIILSTAHRDFPAMLAEALDMIAACDHDMKQASTRLECSASQLTKLIKEHQPAWGWMNTQREQRGLRKLH